MLKCPKCEKEVGYTLGTPNFPAAYKELEGAKSLLAAMNDGELKTLLREKITTAMLLLDAPVSISLR
jgi:hypothetical protein